MRLFVLIPLSLLLPFAGANAQVVDILWSGGGEFTHKGAVPAGKLVEVCGMLPAGLRVRWDFEASAPMDFNVHYHEGKDVVFPSKLEAVATAKDVLETKIKQDYCWMWSNKSAAAVTFAVNLKR